MPYSHLLAERVRQLLRSHRGISEKRMFGGIAFLLHGNVLAGVWQSSLVVRPGPEQAASALQRDHVRDFDVTGRPMKGWIMVDPDGLDSDKELSDWIEAAMTFVETLPAK